MKKPHKFNPLKLVKNARFPFSAIFFVKSTLYSLIYSENIAFTKFLPKEFERENFTGFLQFPQFFRQINFTLFNLPISRKFCQKSLRENSRKFLWHYFHVKMFFQFFLDLKIHIDCIVTNPYYSCTRLILKCSFLCL